MQLTSLMRRVLLYRGSFRAAQKTIMTTPRKMQEVLEELQGNPYYGKYADKIAKVQQVAPETFQNRVEGLAKKKIEPAKGRQFSPLLQPKEKLPAKPQTNEPRLEQLLKLELVQDKSTDEIEAIWQQYHLTKECTIAAVIPAKDFEVMEQRASQFPTFLFPLPRSQGYEFIMCQFEGNRVHLTPLLYFQVHKENAPECLTITHFKELQGDKGIVLMRGEYDGNVLNAKEAQCIANQLQMYYVQTDERKLELLERFTKSPDRFDHMDLVEEISSLSLD